MKVSSRTRYALAILILLYQERQKPLPLSEMAQQLGLSKLYLEQVISVLRSHQLVYAIKGPSGGYVIQRRDITLLDVFMVMEADQFNNQEENAFEDQQLNQILNELVYSPLTQHTQQLLEKITLEHLSQAYIKNMMFFI
jgi:Rrf2 family transcriptional regulator, cysteine metabolism repressor